MSTNIGISINMGIGTSKIDKTKVLDRFSLNAGQTYCRIPPPLEHSAILLTCIKRKSVLKKTFWSSLELRQILLYYSLNTYNKMLISILNYILRDFKNAPFYILCFFNMIDLRMFSLSFFILMHYGPWFAMLSNCSCCSFWRNIDVSVFQQLSSDKCEFDSIWKQTL